MVWPASSSSKLKGSSKKSDQEGIVDTAPVEKFQPDKFEVISEELPVVFDHEMTPEVDEPSTSPIKKLDLLATNTESRDNGPPK